MSFNPVSSPSINPVSLVVLPWEEETVSAPQSDSTFVYHFSDVAESGAASDFMLPLQIIQNSPGAVNLTQEEDKPTFPHFIETQPIMRSVRWTKQESDRLLALVAGQAKVNWQEIANQFYPRDWRQCYNRHNYLTNLQK